MFIKEFCAENLTELFSLTSEKVQRVELCDNLAVGGTTPSYGVIKEAARHLHEKNITVATMIRPRGGNFVYNDLELRVMEEDILQAVELETDYLVLGLLTKENLLDHDGIQFLLPATKGLPLVFHMAFDSIPKSHQKEAIDELIEYGFTRILLHGSDEKNDIFNNIDHLNDLINYADGRIELMLGGGVTAENCNDLVKKTKVTAVHGTKIN